MIGRRVPGAGDPIHRAVVDQVEKYCARQVPDQGLHVSVEASVAVSAERRARIRAGAEEAGTAACGRRVLIRLRVVQRDGLANEEVRVRVELAPARTAPPRASVNRPEPTAPEPTAPEPTATHASTRPYTAGAGVHGADGTPRWSLRVVYLADPGASDGPSFVFSLTAADGWIPFGREPGGPPRRRSLDFGSMRALPSGWLIEVRATSGGLIFRRSVVRPSYVVSLNEVPLARGVELVGSLEGTLVYRQPPAADQTMLRYLLAREGAA